VLSAEQQDQLAWLLGVLLDQVRSQAHSGKQ
jgi:hypothetical protein